MKGVFFLILYTYFKKKLSPSSSPGGTYRPITRKLRYMKQIMIEGSFEYVIFFRNFQKKLWTSDVMNFMIMSEFKCLYIYIFETAIFNTNMGICSFCTL